MLSRCGRAPWSVDPRPGFVHGVHEQQREEPRRHEDPLLLIFFTTTFTAEASCKGPIPPPPGAWATVAAVGSVPPSYRYTRHTHRARVEGIVADAHLESHTILSRKPSSPPLKGLGEIYKFRIHQVRTDETNTDEKLLLRTSERATADLNDLRTLFPDTGSAVEAH